jgi:RNA 3'-phosphate cyclase
MKNLIEIDGSYQEGGGQILRTALALSSVLEKPCRVYNIRKNRPKPGLMTQHLLGLKALKELCGAKLEGDYLESKEIIFYPGRILKDQLFINIPTAGSITLILQTLTLPSLFSLKPVKIKFKGGATDTFFSPTFDYYRFIFLKILEKMEAKIEVNLIKRGFYPTGKAELEVKVFPIKSLKQISLIERGKLEKILILSGASQILKEKKVAERQIAGVREILGKLKLPLEEKIEYSQTASPGSYICLIAKFEKTLIGSDNLGKLGKRAEDIGRETALGLLKEAKTNVCLDKHMADQILPYLAISGKGEITVSQVTSHAKTNIWVIEKFLPRKFKIEDKKISWA